MKMVIAGAVLTLARFAPGVYAGEKAAVAQAQAAARPWLALTDAGKYAESWDEAATFFKAAVTQPDWERMVKAVRGPLGALKSRKLQSATFTRTLPGAPDGEYVVLRYATTFEQKASAVETVTPMHDQDGSWRVSGYYIK
jgi:hypothetical protein